MASKGAAVAFLLIVASAGCMAPTALGASARGAAPPPETHGNRTAAFVDVGQGDGTVWTLPDGSIIVYDCGPRVQDAGSSPIIQYLTSSGRPPGSTLWAVIASHGHLDHIGGCEEVVAEYDVKHIY